MFLLKYGILLILILLATCELQQSPCPNVFHYDSSQIYKNSWAGQLYLYSDDILHGVTLRIIFDKLPNFLQELYGWNTRRDSSGYILSNPNYVLTSHTIQILVIKIVYFGPAPLPQIRTIYLNEKLICPEGQTTPTPTILQPSAPKLVSPCPGLFTYESFETDKWYGIIHFKLDQVQQGVTIRIILDNEALKLGSHFAPARIGGANDYIINLSNFSMTPNNPTHIRFYVLYDITKSIPQVKGIEINSKLLCTNSNYQIPNKNSDPITVDAGEYSEDECGTVVPKATSLIVHGETTDQAEWPWHAVLYFQGQYICGGSLVSLSHVVTAAHCVYDPKKKREILASKLIVYLGKQFLERWGRKIQEFMVDKINVHPEYDQDDFLVNDVATITLDHVVDFNNYVRPICLWSEDADLNNIVNTTGTVVGFGYDASRELSKEIQKTNLLVIAHETCLLSYPDFYSKVLRDTNYCAGFRNGSSPCNGDSGGGMVFKRGNKNIWYLRGIASTSVSKNSICDTNHYTIFTDVAKFIDWIQGIVQLV